MSDFTVLAEIGESLASVLFQEMNSDPVVKALIDVESRISLQSPADLKNDNSARLSIYLYRIVEDPYMKNQLPVEGTGGRSRKAPLTLDLYYLMTPLVGTPREQHVVLGKAMQVLYDRAILQGSDLAGSLVGSGEEIRMILNPVSLEETTRVWQALESSYRLSLCYTARVAIVNSQDEEFRQPVVYKRADYGYLGSRG
jgi:Pvc16 N-terminal domain